MYFITGIHETIPLRQSKLYKWQHTYVHIMPRIMLNAIYYLCERSVLYNITCRNSCKLLSLLK